VKKLFVSAILVAVGAGAWWLLSQTARFSVKKWDAKFGSVLRQELHTMGLSNQDILSSVNEVKIDAGGEWIVQRMSVKLTDSKKQKEIKAQLEDAGATVAEKLMDDKTLVYTVSRGARVYQEISFVHP
jgi:hypothetical protein